MAPLSFGWTGSIPAKVFDDTKEIADISKGTLGQIIPLDVLVHSNLTFQKNHPSSGNGLTDILHIHMDDTKSVYQLTGLLSKPDRSTPEEVNVEQQGTVEFAPPVIDSRFHTGDFAGDSRVGLVYVFEDKESGSIQFIQFTSDGTKMVPKAVEQGPSVKEGDFENMRVISGDLDGNGADDLFLVYPRSDATPESWNIAFLESKNGSLVYRSDNPFDEIGKKLAFVEDTTILSFNADNDSKAGLLFVTKSTAGKLQFQLLRSTGTTLLADNTPTPTAVDYSGNVTVTRITSANTLDVVNVADSPNGPKLHVFRFDSHKFSEIPNTTQPSDVPQGSLIRWSDLRGIGRSDCILNTYNANTGLITVNSMLCSGLTLSGSQWQPLDCTYKSSDSVVKALTNSLADNSASSGVLTGSQGSAQNMFTPRAQLVSFPRFVVHRLNTRLGTGTINTLLYTYSNARVDFGGRGWLGFETITKIDVAPGIRETSSYFQQFPLVGIVSRLETKGVSPMKMLKVYEYSWTSIDVNDEMNKAIQLPRLKESYYETSVTPSYDVEVQFTYDMYGNATKTQIGTQHDISTFLSIESTSEEPVDDPSQESRWIVGNKLTEETKLNSTILGQIKNDYFPGTTRLSRTRNWVDDSNWSTTTYSCDVAGNLTLIEGPDKRQLYEYDDTCSNLTMTTTLTGVSASFIETAEYEEVLNLVLGLPSTVMQSNKLLNSFKYDALGRKIEKSQGTDKSSMEVIEKVAFAPQDTKLVEILQLLMAWIPQDPHLFVRKGSTNRAITIDELSDGTTNRRVIREMVLLPNADTPAGGSFVKPCVVRQHDEQDQSITTEFDGLTRPTSITDPNGVQLTLAHDGLSREVSRKITTGTGTNINTMSHFTATFDDEKLQTTLRNVLTGAAVFSDQDYYGRLTRKVTMEETVNFTYDAELLSEVASTKNFSQRYTYDSFGNVATSTLSVDEKDFKSSFTWTKMGQLLTPTNPDGSSLMYTLLADGITPQSLTLANPSKEDKASATFSSFDNPYGRPLTCHLGSGSSVLTSQSTIANDGMLTSNVVANGSTQLLKQSWDFDAFKQVTKYSLTKAETTTEKYKYNVASQLTEVSSDEGLSEQAVFSYDSSGNISKHSNLSFINDGWQLTSIKNPDQSIAYTFQYLNDGKRTSEKDGSGSAVDAMTYDSEGRLIKLIDTEFEYDYTGRLAKSTTVEGSATKTTIYVNDNYEFDTITIVTNGDFVTQKMYTAYLVKIICSQIIEDVEKTGSQWELPSPECLCKALG
ncbi:hypothetical protein AMATHDRAFT_44274 [Amanita thiersii Skay4041]|uniref:Insecticide toxin TcdB middle/N-terminal domain-containing protein n=1 Tax=Amanita thiersii Skay4041 TaxID=703135 RepID=A0A2A9NAU6_9AGAR|nr:hypothetical protein AMATHDRAFT_44274 [Amanita thiersii Skay4041]